MSNPNEWLDFGTRRYRRASIRCPKCGHDRPELLRVFTMTDEGAALRVGLGEGHFDQMQTGTPGVRQVTVQFVCPSCESLMELVWVQVESGATFHAYRVEKRTAEDDSLFVFHSSIAPGSLSVPSSPAAGRPPQSAGAAGADRQAEENSAEPLDYEALGTADMIQSLYRWEGGKSDEA